MRVARELKLRDFPFWGGAEQRAKKLSASELDYIESVLTDCVEEDFAWDETTINDFIWFDDLTYIEWLGIDEEEWEERFA